MDRVESTQHGEGPTNESDQAGQPDHDVDDGSHGSGTEPGHDDEADHEIDMGQRQAARIAVHEPPGWYGGVIWGSGLLFVLAATLGSIAIIAKGPEPPDPADVHAHGTGDDHGHH